MVKKHESTVSELNKPYEKNVIGFDGIVKFAIGLFLLIVITFALMLVLNRVLEDNKVAEFKQQENPMAMSDKDKLPPEPRLQLAPGFGVDSPNGRVNMELGAPQAEYRELRHEWDEILKHGKKDAATGAVVSMPIEEAKAKVLEEHLKATSGPEADKLFVESRKYISDASSGRRATATRR